MKFDFGFLIPDIQDWIAATATVLLFMAFYEIGARYLS